MNLLNDNLNNNKKQYDNIINAGQDNIINAGLDRTT